MMYKFHIAGPGKPEIEMRGPRLISGNFELYSDGKLIDKIAPMAKRKLIKMPNGESYYISTSRFFPYMVYYPPQVSIDNEIVIDPEKPRFYEIIYYFFQFLIMMLIFSSITTSVKLTHHSRLPLTLIIFLSTFMIALMLLHNYVKTRINRRPFARIVHLIINLAILGAYGILAKAVVIRIFR